MLRRKKLSKRKITKESAVSQSDRGVQLYRNKTAFQEKAEYGRGVVAVEDNSGDDNTKVKDENNVADKVNCVG